MTLQDRSLLFISRHSTKPLPLSSVHVLQVGSSEWIEWDRFHIGYSIIIFSFLLPTVLIPLQTDELGSLNPTQKSKENISGPLGIYAFMESDSSFCETPPLVVLFSLHSRVYPINVIDTSHILVELLSPNSLCLVTHRRVCFSFPHIEYSTRFGLKQWSWQTRGIICSLQSQLLAPLNPNPNQLKIPSSRYQNPAPLTRTISRMKHPLTNVRLR